MQCGGGGVRGGFGLLCKGGLQGGLYLGAAKDKLRPAVRAGCRRGGVQLLAGKMQLGKRGQQFNNALPHAIGVLALKQDLVVQVQLPRLGQGELQVVGQLFQCGVGKQAFVLERLVDGGTLQPGVSGHAGDRFPALVQQFAQIGGKF